MIGLLVVLSASIVISNAAPATYDQRQDGELNLHAKLENFLIVIATPSNTNAVGSLNNLALQALEGHLASRKYTGKEEREEPLSPGQDYRTAVVFQELKEPYKVEIVGLQAEQPEASSANAGTVGEEIARVVAITQSPVEKSRIEVNKVAEGVGESKKEEESKEPYKVEIVGLQVFSGKVEKTEEETARETVEDGIKKVVEGVEEVERVEEKVEDAGSKIAKSRSELKELVKAEEETVEDEIKTVEEAEKVEDKVEDAGSMIAKTRSDFKESVKTEEETARETIEDEMKKVAEAVEDAERVEEKVEDAGSRTAKLWGGFKESVNSARHGATLKKELSTKGKEAQNDEVFGASDRNEVELVGNKRVELKLLGDAIENCGPERFRNQFGVCQFGISD